MDVLMGVEMARIPADKAAEDGHLPAHLDGDRGRVVEGDHGIQRLPLPTAIRPFTEIDMEAQVEVWVCPTVARSCSRRRPADHEAGAGHDATAMSFDNPPIDASALAKIIGIDD